MVDADFNFKMPKIEMTEESEDGKYGRFVVEPLERGYGLTLGNSLRRIMLSSLVGTAVSSVKIEGVLHEFSSIPGVKEDVTEIIMNIKQLSIGRIAYKHFKISLTASSIVIASVATSKPAFFKSFIRYVTCGAARPIFSSSL